MLTLNDVYNSRIPAALGLCAPDARIAAYVNEAQQRAMMKGLWFGTVAKFRIAAYDGILTMPPVLDTIESVAINHVPVQYHDLLYEFLEYGFGTRSRDQVGTNAGSSLAGTTGVCGLPEANYRGSFPTFRDLTLNSNAKKVVAVCDLAADVTAAVKMTVLGYDANGNWIRTLQGAAYADGEVIALAQSPGTTSVNTFSSITGIQFSSQRSGQCWLYELDTVTNIQTLTGWYQWFETNPSYGRWLFPSIAADPATFSTPNGWQQKWTQAQIPAPASGATFVPTLVEVIGKRAFIPVSLPSDYLLIQNIPALKLMCQSLKKQEDGVSQADLGEAVGYSTMAIKELDDQLDTMLGSGRRIGLTVTGSGGPDGTPIETFV